jgi:diacylglycerol kinase family enzyme
MEGETQAHMEDGRFDVAVIRGVSTLDLMSDAIAEGLLGRDTDDLVRFESADLRIRNHDPASVRFSLEGEIVQHRELSLAVEPGVLSAAVGEDYDPDPD